MLTTLKISLDRRQDDIASEKLNRTTMTASALRPKNLFNNMPMWLNLINPNQTQSKEETSQTTLSPSKKIRRNIPTKH